MTLGVFGCLFRVPRCVLGLFRGVYVGRLCVFLGSFESAGGAFGGVRVCFVVFKCVTGSVWVYLGAFGCISGVLRVS